MTGGVWKDIDGIPRWSTDNVELHEAILDQIVEITERLYAAGASDEEIDEEVTRMLEQRRQRSLH